MVKVARVITLEKVKLAFLICVFGTGSWVAVNGLWVELPVLVGQSPQQWSLPSYLTVVIQLANIGPLVYLLLQKYAICKSKVVTETRTIYFILFVGALASILLAFTWKETSVINNKPYSTSLIVLSFFMATVDCTSSVTFLPFMANFPSKFMTIYYVGEGMSGLVPSVVAMIQGVGKQSYTCEERVVTKNMSLNYTTKKGGAHARSTTVLKNGTMFNSTEIVPSYFHTEPRFSATVFFVVITCIMVCSLTAFILLIRIKNKNVKLECTQDAQEMDQYNSTKCLQESNASFYKDKNSGPNSSAPSTVGQLNNRKYYFLLLLNGVINGISNGVLPALQSYACLPYGNNIYHLTLTMSAVANPVCCFLYFLASVQSSVVIFIGVCVYLASASYTIGIAATSPCPLWNDSSAGGVVVLLVTVFGVGLVSYLKTAISTVIRSHGYKGLLLCGVSVQVGSLVGALIIFPLVNVYGYFKQSQACQVC